MIGADESVRNLAQFVLERGSSFSEKRESQRFPFVAEALVHPLDETGQPAGEPFWCVTTDLSASGMGLLVESDVDSDLLDVEIPVGPNFNHRMRLEVVRRRPVQGFVQIGGRLISRAPRGR